MLIRNILVLNASSFKKKKFFMWIQKIVSWCEIKNIKQKKWYTYGEWSIII